MCKDFTRNIFQICVSLGKYNLESPNWPIYPIRKPQWKHCIFLQKVLLNVHPYTRWNTFFKTFLSHCITTWMLNFGTDRLNTVDIFFGSLDIQIFPVLASFSTSFVSPVVFIHHSHFYPLLTLLKSFLKELASLLHIYVTCWVPSKNYTNHSIIVVIIYWLQLVVIHLNNSFVQETLFLVNIYD